MSTNTYLDLNLLKFQVVKINDFSDDYIDKYNLYFSFNDQLGLPIPDLSQGETSTFKYIETLVIDLLNTFKKEEKISYTFFENFYCTVYCNSQQIKNLISLFKKSYAEVSTVVGHVKKELSIHLKKENDNYIQAIIEDSNYSENNVFDTNNKLGENELDFYMTSMGFYLIKKENNKFIYETFEKDNSENNNYIHFLHTKIKELLRVNDSQIKLTV